MIRDEIALLLKTFDLNRAALAHLLSVSPKTLYRWERLEADQTEQHPARVLVRVLATRMTTDPHSVASLRALALISSSRSGLEHLLDRCIAAYLVADQKG